METVKKEFLKVLLKVQSEMPTVGRNAEGYNYKYASIDKVWEDCEKVISNNGFFINNELTEKGVKTLAHHELGTLESFIPYSHADLKPQERGSEITYYRRYNLTAMFNIIVSGEDDDAAKAQESNVYSPSIQCENCGGSTTNSKFPNKEGKNRWCGNCKSAVKGFTQKPKLDEVPF